MCISFPECVSRNLPKHIRVLRLYCSYARTRPDFLECCRGSQEGMPCPIDANSLVKFAYQQWKDKSIENGVLIAGTIQICTVCDATRRRMKWLGCRGHLHKRRHALLPKTDIYPQGLNFHLTLFLPCRDLVVASMKGGPLGSRVAGRMTAHTHAHAHTHICAQWIGFIGAFFRS